MAKLVVKVHGTSCEVSTYKTSSSMWEAVGDYLGERFEGKGRTVNNAIRNWTEKAKYSGNDSLPGSL